MLLILFGGITDRLIPLFAVGAFLAFTLSQAGMVAHWRKKGGGFHHKLINGFGAVVTGVTVVIVVAAKFTEGAWVVVLLVGALIVLMKRVHRHYRRVAKETEVKRGSLLQNHMQPPIVIVPVERWNTVTQKALEFAMTLSSHVQVVHVAEGEHDDIAAEFRSAVEEPAHRSGAAVPQLVSLRSPYRMVLQPLVDYVLQVEKENPDRTIAVAIPTLVEHHWYHYFLHNQRSERLTAMLLLGGNQRINIINVPWYLQK